MIDIYYKIKNIKKPIFLDSIKTFNNGKIIDNKLELKNLNMNIIHDKYSKKLGATKNPVYNGIINYNFINFAHNIKHYMVYIPKRVFIGFFETIFFICKYAISNIISFCISKRIIVKGGKKVRQFKITVGNKEHRLLTETTMEKIYKTIDKLVKTINDGVKDNEKISFYSKENSFILQRFEKEVTIYTPGDSSIYAQVLENENTINIRYEIKESKWGIKYWSYDNKYITPYNMAINILNYFVLYTSINK